MNTSLRLLLGAASSLIPLQFAFGVPCGQLGNVPVCSIVNSPGEFIASAGGVAGLRLIDFETGPDGLPSYPGEIITPSFNYTDLGVTFTAPIGVMRISGPSGGRGLLVDTLPPFPHTWIDARFETSTNAAGIWYSGGTSLYAYDLHDTLLGQITYSAPGGAWFLGITSDIPIARVVADRNAGLESIADFVFNSPESRTLSLLLLGSPMLLRHRVRKI
jgi:hypothetical protein